MAQRVFLRTGRGLALTPRSLQITRPFSTVLDTPVDPGTQQLRSVARAGSVFENAVNASAPRTNWTKEEISEVYNTSLIDLTYASASVHRRFHDPAAIQMCTLFNIKTGGCSEDCSYCAQSSRYDTGLKATKLSSVDSVLQAARIAKENGSSRFCMGAAWRDMRGRKTNLKNIKEMIKGVRGMGMEACVTLGMVDAAQAKELKDAGLTAYNHNVDTSREHYPSVITTRTYDERLNTIKNVQEAGIHVCTGGILGLGEKARDHVGLIHTVATLPAHPESFPVNALVPIKGTPLGETEAISFDAILRTIATARLVMPTTIIRLAAGRHTMRAYHYPPPSLTCRLAAQMSRRYPTAELYEERERDFYRNGNRSERNYEELDLELRRGAGPDPRRSAPDFFREDYNRPTAGPMVLRGRDEDNFSRAGPRSSRGGFDDDVRSTRSRPPPPPSAMRGMERDDISIRHSEAPTRRGRDEIDETDITIKRREQSRGPPERDDIVFRRGDGPPVRSVSRPAPRQVDDDDVRFRGRGGNDIDFHASRSEVSRHGRDVSAERGSIRFQERDGNFEIRANRREFSRDGRDTSRERSSLTIRGRERSLPPPARNRGDLVAREREEFVIRRPRAESPPANNREVIRDEIIIRRKEERAPTPSPSPSPPPPPPPPAPEPEIRPPIIQEIITHHRHIDHGVVRARSPTPPPPPAPPSPPPPINETLEIEINRRESHSRGRGRSNFEELDIDINFNRDQGSVKQKKKDMWTEITKDLVIREAIDSMGYSCEETDDFFYVMEYLRYEDVLHLVEISDEIRRKRKSRIREIEIERKSIHDSRPASAYDDRFYEHEVSFDSRRSRYR